jgi:Fanconi anemia group M protein
MQQNPSGLVIKADDRERDSGIAMMLREQFHMDVVEERLRSGDYVIGEKLVVERKTVDDLALSIVDGRLFQQVLRMKQRFETALLIIEGNFTQAPRIDLHPHALKGGIMSVVLEWNTPVLFSNDAHDTALTLWLIGEQRKSLQGEQSYRPGRRPKRLRNRQVYVLQGLPSVGPKLAVQLLEHFGSVEKVVTAPQERLVDVPGVGKKKAQKIRDVVSLNFRGAKIWTLKQASARGVPSPGP